MPFLLSLKQFIGIPIYDVHKIEVLLILNQICFDFLAKNTPTIKKQYKIP